MEVPANGSRAGDEAEILGAISEVARRHLDWSGELRPEMDLVQDLELDSLRLLTLAAEVENRFEICLDADDEAGLVTVGDLVEVVRSKLRAQVTVEEDLVRAQTGTADA